MHLLNEMYKNQFGQISKCLISKRAGPTIGFYFHNRVKSQKDVRIIVYTHKDIPMAVSDCFCLC